MWVGKVTLLPLRFRKVRQVRQLVQGQSPANPLRQLLSLSVLQLRQLITRASTVMHQPLQLLQQLTRGERKRGSVETYQ